MTGLSNEPVPVSVSAANYSQLSDDDLYARLNDPANDRPEAPAVHKQAKPLYYLLLPGEVYPNDATQETVYRELEISLEHRGYFNAVYQKRAGHMPATIDYLLRVHYGERLWLTPAVRGDRVTWGNDGLVANRYKINLMFDHSYDPRVGLSPVEMLNTLHAFAFLATGGFGTGMASSRSPSAYYGMDTQLSRDFSENDQASHDFYLVVVEAFKFDEVRAMNKKAPCIWATFIAVPVDRGQTFSSVLRAMVQTAEPYFGETTPGIQLYKVPPGKVFVGTPVEVSGPQKAPLPSVP